MSVDSISDSSFATEVRNLASGLDGVTPSSLDDIIARADESFEQAARECVDRIVWHPDWDVYAGRLLVASLRRSVPNKFSQAIEKGAILFNDDFLTFVRKYSTELDEMIVPDRDLKFTYFAMLTMKSSYLACTRFGGVKTICELPQYLYLRVAIQLYHDNNPDSHRCLPTIKQTYDSLSSGDYTHASPTMFNSGMKCPQLASCFLMDIQDSLDDITKKWREMAFISKHGGGIGIDVSRLRHSEIANFGESSGIVGWVRNIGIILETTDQTGKRKGSGTVYLCDWHRDIGEFVEMRLPTGSEEMRSRKLFYAVYVSDLFMKRVAEDKQWSLMCPKICPGLVDTWGDDFETLYLKYESEGRYYKQLPARELFFRIINSQIVTGMPFIVYKDAVNRKSNQQNLGTIQCSNLCTEIVQYVSPDETAICNLASIALPRFVSGRSFDFEKLERITREIVRNLNQVIDRTYYVKEVPQTKTSNLRHRPMGIGVQGLADTYFSLGLAWEDEDCRQLNSEIFETIYYAAVSESCNLAKIDGPYSSFHGSPLSREKFQFDLWDEEPRGKYRDDLSPPRPHRISAEKWQKLREEVMEFGVRNSLLVAVMPTASSAQILGNSECIEPINSNIFKRTVLSGEFVVVNKYLVNDLMKLGMWTTETVKTLIENGGSCQTLIGPNPFVQRKLDKLKRIYKTVYEVPLHVQVDHMADRSRFICQSSSFNCHLSDSSPSNLAAFHFYGWRRGLKTGMYYARQRATVDPLNISSGGITVPPPKIDDTDGIVCISCSA